MLPNREASCITHGLNSIMMITTNWKSIILDICILLNDCGQSESIIASYKFSMAQK